MSIMLREIAEQPSALARTIKNEHNRIARLAKSISRREIDVIILVARGSSDNAALFGRYLLEITTGIPVSLAAPSVHTLYHARLNLKRALVIGVSQSGEGTDINHVLENSRRCGAFTVGITNEAKSPMTKLVDETLLVHAGREYSVAATKTVTGQMLLFYMLSAALANRQAPDYRAIPELVERTLEESRDIGQIVPRYNFMKNCAVVGRGLVYANAYEFALKLMETCYVVAERFSTADFLHGPLAMIENEFPVFLFSPSGVMLPHSLSLIKQLRKRQAHTIAISADQKAKALSTHSITMPSGIDEFLAPIPYMIPAQLFSALLAKEKGLNPAKPRSLSKVTRTL